MRVSGLTAMLKNRRQRELLYSTNRYWDAKARELDGDAVSMWPNNHLNRLYHAEQMAIIGRSVRPLAGCDVLDVGCGTGRLSRVFAARGAKVTGIDFSTESIQLARQHGTTGQIEYRVQSIFELADADRYDLIVSLSCLTVASRSRSDLIRALRNLHTAVRRRGQIFLLEPIHRGFLHRVLDMGVDDFCDAVREAGFRVQSVEQMHFWPMRLALAFVPWPEPMTKLGYHAGQRFMKLGVLQELGDYKAISAVRC